MAGKEQWEEYNSDFMSASIPHPKEKGGEKEETML